MGTGSARHCRPPDSASTYLELFLGFVGRLGLAWFDPRFCQAGCWILFFGLLGTLHTRSIGPRVVYNQLQTIAGLHVRCTNRHQG